MESMTQSLVQLGIGGICLAWFMLEQRKHNDKMIAKLERITAYFAASQPPDVQERVETLLGVESNA